MSVNFVQFIVINQVFDIVQLLRRHVLLELLDIGSGALSGFFARREEVRAAAQRYLLQVESASLLDYARLLINGLLR